jgi:pimeloyl-ACP methyl ester carboxylesterase
MADAKHSGSRARQACRLPIASAISAVLGVLSIAAVPASTPAARTETPIPANIMTLPLTTGSSARTAALSVPAGPSFPGLVNIGGGRKMYLECMGRGSPTVILESGYRNNSAVWNFADTSPAVLPGVAKFTRVCAYDRPGTFTYLPPDGKIDFSKSTPVHQPTTAASDVSDLHRLLSRAHIPGPYVLVAHSAGGLIAQLYASSYGRSAAGMVLLDAFPAVIAQLLGPSWPAYLSILNAVPPGLEHYKALEYLNFGTSFHQVLGARPLPRMPLIILSHSPSHPFVLPPNAPAGLAKKLETAWAKGQDYLASLEPHSAHIIANTDHYIQTEDPQLVVQSIRTVVDDACLKGLTSLGQANKLLEFSAAKAKGPTVCLGGYEIRDRCAVVGPLGGATPGRASRRACSPAGRTGTVRQART